MPSQAVMVAGYNYMAWGKRPDGVSFAGIAERRAAKLIAETRDLTVWLFDFQTGRLKLNPPAKKRGWLPVPVRSWKEPSRALNYEGHAFTKNPEGIMSIVDVYEHVQTIGRKAPRTLTELSFFSHGYYQGPILMNSKDRDPKGTKRDPADKDGRYNKDFYATTLRSGGPAALRAAFANGGRVWLWGCNWDPAFYEIFESFSRTPAYRQAPPGRLTDDKRLQLTFRAEQAERIFPMSREFFPAPTAAGKPVLQFERTVGEIRELYDKILPRAYAERWASVAKVLAYGALPGTWATYDPPGPTALMHVPQEQVKDAAGKSFEGFKRYLEFWTGYVGVTVDHEYRGYGTFLPRERRRRRPGRSGR